MNKTILSLGTYVTQIMFPLLLFFTCRIVDDPALPVAKKSAVEQLGPSTDISILSLPNVKTDKQQSIWGDRFHNTLLSSSKSQVEQIGFHIFCPECRREVQYCHHHHRLSQALPHLPSKNPNPICEREDADAPSIIDSFGTPLGVPNSHPHVNGLVAASNSVVAIPRSCREEATTSLTSLDDTTVDDLAGYLDQIMFLPKPMSEMAELMYT